MARSPLLPIFLTVFVDVLGLTLVLPLLPFYAEHFGASPLVVGTLSASFAGCQLVSGPVLGSISDKVGRKPTLLVSQIGTCIGFLILGGASSLWMLFLGRIIDGITAGNLSIAQAYISDVSKPEDRTKALGLIGVAFGMGFLIGPAISGVMARRFGYGAPPFAAALLSLASILVTAFLLREPERSREGPMQGAAEGPPREIPSSRLLLFARFFARPIPRRRLIELFAFTLSFSTLVGGLALFLERQFGLDVEKTGYVYAFSGLVGALIQGGIIGRLVKRLGEERLSGIGFIAMGLGYSVLGAVHTIPLLLAVIVVSSFGSAVARPTITALLTKSVGREEQGAALGVSQSLSSISQIVGPLTAGLLIEHRQLLLYGLVAGMFAALGAVLSHTHVRRDAAA